MKRNQDVKSIVHRFIDGEKQLYPILEEFAKNLTNDDVDCYSNYLRAFVNGKDEEMFKQKQLILKEYKRPQLKKSYETKKKQ